MKITPSAQGFSHLLVSQAERDSLHHAVLTVRYDAKKRLEKEPGNETVEAYVRDYDLLCEDFNNYNVREGR